MVYLKLLFQEYSLKTSLKTLYEIKIPIDVKLVKLIFSLDCLKYIFKVRINIIKVKGC